ncbi:MAG TPA: class I SAM-dependent methyltransferase, partial [Actinomycetota bacterium]
MQSRAKDRVRALDQRYLGGRARDWWLRHGVLGGRWGEFLDELERVPAGAVVLDHGAGEAELRARLPGRRYLALDIGVGHSGWDYSGLDVVGDVMRLPLADARIDVVVSKQVLEHVPEPIATLREIARVLRPGGTVLLSTNQSWPQHQQPYDFFRFTSYGLRYCFEQAGLQVERVEAMGGAFTAAMFGVSQTLTPHLWSRGARAQRIAAVLLTPFAWLMKLLTPLVSMLDRLDRTKDNTLG